MSVKQVQRIVIVGGGTAGWMTAAMLAHHFRKTRIDITLIESTAMGTVGVGEATIPTIRAFYAELGLTDAEVMAATQGTAKLGIAFDGWRTPDSRFIHPFGGFGQSANGIDFHHYWLKQHRVGNPGELQEYSLAIQLAQQHKFALPSPNPSSELSVFNWALHFDASAFGALMRDQALSRGVTPIDATIEGVNLDSDQGHITTVTLGGGRRVSADLFIDCSGFRALLIQGALKTGYCDWRQWLACDRAVAVQSERITAPPPYTVSLAHKAGWQWRIPLQHRQGNGHVYSSDWISDEEALMTLQQHIDGPLTREPRTFRFTPGRSRLAWHKNCVAVGLASGFLEPLESTSIALVETAIQKIRNVFSGPYYTGPAVDSFNQLTAQEYERVRDFIILHYHANGRDEGFWQACRERPIPDSLAAKLDAYHTRGELLRYPGDIFGGASWLAVLSGMGRYPAVYHPAVDRLDPGYLQQSLAQMRENLRAAVAAAPTHEAFLADWAAGENVSSPRNAAG